MLNLSQITAYYITTTYLPIVQKTIFESFTLLESFGLQYYEDKYVELIQRSDGITSESKQDQFIFYLQADIAKIIEDHFIKINHYQTPTLEELNELAHFLYIIQSLENYDIVAYRLYSDDTPKNVLTDLITHFTLLSKPRSMELIESVSERFIDALRAYIEDKVQETNQLDKSHLTKLKMFFKFIENSPCLGLTYYEQGYINVTLEELLNLISLDVPAHIDDHIEKQLNVAQAALDTLSILMLCKDTYEIPLLKFKQNSFLFTNKLEHVTKLHTAMFNMLNDFNMFLDVEKEREKANGN